MESRPPRSGRTRVSDGAEIAYQELGDGPSILVVHGGWGSSQDWMPVASFLGAKFRVILIDRRRHGKSGWGSQPATLEREAEDVLEMCRAHRPMAAVVGHSAGGLIALHAALKDEDGLIPNLVLYDPAVSFGAVLGGRIDDFRRAIERGEYEKAMAGILPVAGVTESEQELIKRPEFWPGLVARAPQELDFLVSACRLEPGFKPYRHLQIRTLVLRGANTIPALRERVQALAEAMPNATLFVIEGQGHMANAFVPELIADRIAAFIDER